jgi:hypothetical protein
MFVVVTFGYRQNRVYNINCQVGPLLDLVQRQCFADVQQYFTQKQRAFNKDIAEITKRMEETRSRLNTLEHPPVEEEKKAEAPRAKRGGKRDNMPKTSPPVEPVPVVKPPEVETPKVEVKAKPAPAKGAKGKKEVVVEELSPEEIARRKLEEEKEALRTEIASMHATIAKYNEKLTKMQEIKEPLSAPLLEIDLADRGGERKYLRSKLEEQANSMLAAKGTYVLVRRKTAEAEEFEPFTYDGYCVRTPEEDLTFVEEVVETKKGGAKKKK